MAPPVCGSVPPAGEFSVAVITDVFAGIFELLTTLCVHVRVSDASVWSLGLFGFPVHGSAPLAGRTSVTNTFAGLFELSPIALHVYAYSLRAWAALKPICFVWT